MPWPAGMRLVVLCIFLFAWFSFNVDDKFFSASFVLFCSLIFLFFPFYY